MRTNLPSRWITLQAFGIGSLERTQLKLYQTVSRKPGFLYPAFLVFVFVPEKLREWTFRKTLIGTLGDLRLADVPENLPHATEPEPREPGFRYEGRGASGHDGTCS